MTERIEPASSATSVQDALRWYVTGAPTPGPYTMVSTYQAALRDARGVTGRHPETGEDPSHRATWLGALGYLCWLDQVGRVLDLDEGAPAELSSVERSLRLFGPREMNDRDRVAMWGLRCALAHRFSLFNVPKNRRRTDLFFHFALYVADDGVLMRHAEKPWAGNFDDASDANATVVNLQTLGDVAEQCHRTITTASQLGKLRSQVSIGELLVRYSFGYAPGG